MSPFQRNPCLYLRPIDDELWTLRLCFNASAELDLFKTELASLVHLARMATDGDKQKVNALDVKQAKEDVSARVLATFKKLHYPAWIQRDEPL